MASAALGDRSLFPELSCHAYLAHAAISPLSAPVVARIGEVASAYARGGMSGFQECVPTLKGVREHLARQVGASEREVAFVSNTSQGVLDIAFGLSWRKGDRVLLFEGEFPTNVTPWQRAAEEFGLQLCWDPLATFERSLEEGLDQLERRLARGLRLVAVSAVQYKTGLRMPLEAMAELCHRHGAELFVDAIQAVGSTPIDVSCGIDYLSCGGHKHLMGPEGAGFLFVSERCEARCVPRLASWLSHENPVDFLIGDEPTLDYDKPFRSGARVFEIGTSNVLGLAGLGASLELLSTFGHGVIHRHVNGYLDLLEEGLVERGFQSHRSPDPNARSTLLSLSVPDGVRPTQLASLLSKRGVVCNTPDGSVRFAPHWPNHPREVPGVLDAIDEALAELGG